MQGKILTCSSGKASAIIIIVTVACLLGANAISAGQTETGEDKSKRGQIESFSSESTGLGDLEASDALKTINKRSINRMIDAPEDDDGEIVRLLEHLLKDRTIQTRAKEALELEKMKKEFGGKLRGLIEEETEEGRSRQRSRKEVDSGRQDRLKLFALPARLAGGDRIAVARRTIFDADKQADEEETPEVMLQNQLGRNNFPLLGEFGSQISLLTTRKAEPARLFAQESEGADELGESSSYYPQILMNGLIGARMNEGQENVALNGGLSSADLSSNSLPRVARATNLIM